MVCIIMIVKRIPNDFVQFKSQDADMAENINFNG